MRLFRKSSLRATFIAIVSFSLLLSFSFSLRMASVAANPIKPNSAPPGKC